MFIIFAGALLIAVVGWGKAVWDLVTGGPTYIGTGGETPIYDRGYLMLQLAPATGMVGFFAVLALSDYVQRPPSLAFPFWGFAALGAGLLFLLRIDTLIRGAELEADYASQPWRTLAKWRALDSQYMGPWRRSLARFGGLVIMVIGCVVLFHFVQNYKAYSQDVVAGLNLVPGGRGL